LVGATPPEKSADQLPNKRPSSSGLWGVLALN
jgi:hypothetical protein